MSTNTTTTIELTYEIVSTSKNGGKIRYNAAGLGKAAALGELYIDTQTLVRQYGGIPTVVAITVDLGSTAQLLPNDFVHLCTQTQADLEATGVKYPAVEAGASALAAFGITQAGRPAARTPVQAPAHMVATQPATKTRRAAPVQAPAQAPVQAPAATPAPARRTRSSAPVHTDTAPVQAPMALAAQGGDSRIDALEATVGTLSGQLAQLIGALSAAPATPKTRR